MEKFFEVSYSRDHRVDIRHDGRILWSFSGNFLTSCTLDMTYYPFDLQQCDIDVESWAYTNESVHLYHLIDDVHLQVRWKYISPVFMGAGRILSRGGAFGFLAFRERGHLVAQFHQVGVTVVPIIEQFEVFDQFLNGHTSI